jgi:hypothetical protein
MEEEDDDNDGSTITVNQNSKLNDGKLSDMFILCDFVFRFRRVEGHRSRYICSRTQIAEYFHRSEESCRAFYLKQRKNISPNDDHVRNISE